MIKKIPRITVGAMIFNEENQILLLKSQKWKGKYIFPSGHLEFLEKLEDAVKREVLEETNLIVDEINFLTKIEFLNSEEFHKGDLHFVGMQYTCKTKNKEIILNHEAQEYLWVHPKETSNLDLEKGTKEAIEYFLSNFSTKKKSPFL